MAVALGNKIANAFGNATVKSNIVNFTSAVKLYKKVELKSTSRLLIHAVAVLGMVFMMYYITHNFNRNPIAITPELKRYPVQHVDFPGVAICNTNRISHKAVVDLAEELLEFQSTTYNVNLTLQELVTMLNSLGSLYTFRETDNNGETAKILHTILERGYNGYDVNRLMKRLTPKCSSMLERCSWGGRDQICDDIFFLRRTQDGYCCIFNYAKRNDGFGSSQIEVFASQSVEQPKNFGFEYGLSIVLNPHIEDNAYKLLPGQGFKVLIFSSHNYPDQYNGGTREIRVPPNKEVFLHLNALILYSKEEVIEYDVAKRGCLFNTEKSNIFQGYYSFNDCIMHCRLRNIFKLCKCLPFFHPHLENSAAVRMCNLEDVPCLALHKNEWIKFKPGFQDFGASFEDKNFNEKHLACACFPSCENIAYSVSTNSIPLTASYINWDRGMRFTVQNHSIIHINFRNIGVVRLRQDILYYWYELMGNYGGICGLFLGVSVIKIMEMLYMLICWFSKPTHGSPSTSKEPIYVTNISTVVQQQNLDVQSLYWHEVAGHITNKPFELFHTPSIK